MSKETIVERTGSEAGTIAAAEREALREADIDPDDVSEKVYSYRLLLDAGVDESVAASLRRQFSLPWSFVTDGDLDRRSAEVRGLGDAERAWVEASANDEWQGFEAARSHATDDEGSESSERPWPRPTPVTAVTAVSPENAARLADAGINSAERLATIDASEVARALELNVLHVRIWRHNAREIVD